MFIITKFYTARTDRVFKTIMCDENDKEFFIEFLERIINKKIYSLEFLKNELPVNTTLERTKTVDCLVKTEDRYIHIELNSQCPNYLHNRNFAFFTSLYAKNTERGEEYDLKTEFLHIDFTYEKTNDLEECRAYYVMDKDGVKYVDNLRIIEYNMNVIGKYYKSHNKEKINKFRHLIMLDLDKNDLRVLAKEDGFVEKFDEKIEKLNNNETFQSLMTYEEDQRKILNTEKHMIKNEIALNFLKNGMSKEIVSENTGLPLKEIEDLMKENNISPSDSENYFYMTYEEDQIKILNTEKHIIKKEIAINLLKNGMDKEIVSENTGLPLKEIEDLMKENNIPSTDSQNQKEEDLAKKMVKEIAINLLKNGMSKEEVSINTGLSLDEIAKLSEKIN